MCHVKGDIIECLGDRNHVFAKCVCYACLVHHVWILAREIYYDNMGTEDEIEDILNHSTFFPNVIDS